MPSTSRQRRAGEQPFPGPAHACYTPIGSGGVGSLLYPSPLIPGANPTPAGRRMKVEYTNNALARMLDRGIREAEVEAVLEAPDHLGPSFEKRWHARKQLEKRALEVIFSRDLLHTQVITAYWQDASP